MKRWRAASFDSPMLGLTASAIALLFFRLRRLLEKRKIDAPLLRLRLSCKEESLPNRKGVVGKSPKPTDFALPLLFDPFTIQSGANPPPQKQDTNPPPTEANKERIKTEIKNADKPKDTKSHDTEGKADISSIVQFPLSYTVNDANRTMTADRATARDF